MPAFSARRTTLVKCPKLDGFTDIIDAILKADCQLHRKQRHTVKRIFERLRDQYGFDGGYTIIKDYVRHHR
jgi:transposase